jgi:nitrous oxidase accessory protein NosD
LGHWRAAGTIVYRNTVAASQYGALLTRVRNFLFGNRSNMELGNLVRSNQVGVRAVGNSRGSQARGTKWSNNRIRLQWVNARQIEVQPRVR